MHTTFRQVLFGCDHTAVAQKEELIAFVREAGIEAVDLGTSCDAEGVYFCDVAERVALRVAAEIANAESILAQIVKDRTSAKTRFAKSLRELSENETETRNRMLETVTQEMPLPERPREPEELLRAEQALREHRSEVVAELGQGADSATENGLKAKILSHMEPDHAYDLDQMLTLMKGHPELSPLRLTALLAKMIRDGVLVRTVYKDKSFYSLA